MNRHGARPTPPHASERDRPERAPDPPGESAGVARKPYARPRLTEHGRVPATTFAAPSNQAASDRNVKEGFEPVDRRAILAAVATLPIERWSYKGEAARHLGPMAQDFAAAFGLGTDDRHIFTLDAAGIALAAIQGLHDLALAQQAQLDALEREVVMLRGEPAALEVRSRPPRDRTPRLTTRFTVTGARA